MNDYPSTVAAATVRHRISLAIGRGAYVQYSRRISPSAPHCGLTAQNGVHSRSYFFIATHVGMGTSWRACGGCEFDVEDGSIAGPPPLTAGTFPALFY